MLVEETEPPAATLPDDEVSNALRVLCEEATSQYHLHARMNVGTDVVVVVLVVVVVVEGACVVVAEELVVVGTADDGEDEGDAEDEELLLLVAATVVVVVVVTIAAGKTVGPVEESATDSTWPLFCEAHRYRSGRRQWGIPSWRGIQGDRSCPSRQSASDAKS